MTAKTMRDRARLRHPGRNLVAQLMLGFAAAMMAMGHSPTAAFDRLAIDRAALARLIDALHVPHVAVNVKVEVR